MRLLHYIEITNFKRFGAEKQRIELDHPAVLIGPNNCGKTTAIQAIALWSQAVRTWFSVKGKSSPKDRPATSLNRLNLVSAPVPRTRDFWHNLAVRQGNADIPLIITVGVLYENAVQPITMRFRNQGNELIYCTPDEETLGQPEVIQAAAELNVELLYPMSGLEVEEAVLQSARIDALLDQGQTAQVLRNLCLLVHQKQPKDWDRIAMFMQRLFSIHLGFPTENARGSIDLAYRKQAKARESLDLSLAGRGLQQMLLILAYLYSHRRSVLLIDEPDAHLEILRQKQVFALLREVATQNESQVVLVTHSEVILDEAQDSGLTLLLRGNAHNLADTAEMRNALKHYGAEHYIRARDRGYVLYVEGGTDLEILRELARKLEHSVAQEWDQRINVYYVRDNFPGSDSDPGLEAELERVAGGFGLTPRKHFFALRGIAAGLRGLAVLDGDGKRRVDSNEGDLRTVYWQRYEIENYFVTPETLLRFVERHCESVPMRGASSHAEEILDALTLERIFGGSEGDYQTWKSATGDVAQLLWVKSSEQLKLSDFAEEFFRRLAGTLGCQMILRKGELHQLIDCLDPAAIPAEVGEKLDLLRDLFVQAHPGEEE